MIQTIIWLLRSIRYWGDVSKLSRRNNSTAKGPNEHYFLNHPISAKSCSYNSNLTLRVTPFVFASSTRIWGWGQGSFNKATTLSPDGKLPSVSVFLPTVSSFPILELFLHVCLLVFFFVRNVVVQTVVMEELRQHGFTQSLVEPLNSLDCLYLNCKFIMWFFHNSIGGQHPDIMMPPNPTSKHRFIECCLPSFQFLTVCCSNHTTLSCSAGSKSDVNAIWNHQKPLREAISELRNKIIQNEWMLILLLTSRHIEWCCLHTQSCTAAQLK